MEATRRYFVRLPGTGSPQYSIPDDSMTTLIYSLFLERQQQYNIAVQIGEQEPYDLNVAAVVVEMMEKRFPGLNPPLGYGGDTAVALYYILQIIIQEGYVTGLEEDLGGTYRSQVTCKTCGTRSDWVDDDIMVTFWVDKGEDFDLLYYLTEGKFEDKHMADNSTRFLTAHHLFNFTERLSAFKAQRTHNRAPSIIL
jgi:hypothetical protein